MRLETLVLELMADTSQLNRSVDDSINRAASRIKSLEGKAITVKAPLQHLVALNKELDLKQDHIIETVRLAKNNPIVVGVDYDEVTEAIKELKELKKEIKDTQENSVKISGDRKSGSSQSQSSQSDGTLFQEVEQRLTGEIKKVVNKVGDVVTAPFAGIGRGFFEGFGQSISKELSKGFMGALDQQLNINVKDYGKKAANATIDYVFPQVKDKKIYEAKAKDYQKTLNELDRIVSDLVGSVADHKGFSVEKRSLSNIQSQSESIREGLKKVKKMKGEGIPSKDAVHEYAQLVVKQISDLSDVSESVSRVSGEVSKKLAIYDKLKSKVSTYEKQIDDAFNTEDYGLLRKVRKGIKGELKEIKGVSGDELIDDYRSRLLHLQKTAKADTRSIAITSDAPSAKDYLLHPVNSLSLMGHKKLAQVETAVEQIKDDIVHLAIESAKATVRGALWTGKGTFKALQAAEDAWMDLAPANEARMGKAVIQRFLPSIALGVASTQFPLLGAGINALAPAAGSIAGGIVHGGLGLAGHGAGMLANAILPDAIISGAGTVMNTAAPIAANIGKFAGFMGNVPGIHGIVEGAGAFGNAVGGLGSTLLVYLGGGRVVSTVVGKITKGVDQSITRAIAPSENPSKYLEAAKSGFKTWEDKYQNKDQYLALMPSNERPALEKAVSVIGQQQKAYRGLFDSLKATGVNFDLTKIQDVKDVKKLGKEASQKVAKWIETQYVIAQNALMDFEDSIANLPKDSKAFGSEISNAKAQLSRRVSLLSKKAEYFGMRLSDVKVERNPHLDSVAVSSVAVPDLTKLERTVGKTTKKVADIWDDTAIEVSASMVEMTETAKKQAYPLQKNLSEGSPGPTHWIRENWAKTSNFVKKQIEGITASSAKLFTQTSVNSGRIVSPYNVVQKPSIETTLNLNPQLLRQHHFQSVVSKSELSASELGVSEIQSGVKAGKNNLDSRLNSIYSRLAGINNETSKYYISVLKKDSFELRQEYEKMRAKLQEKSIKTFGDKLGSAESVINKKYDTQESVLKAEVNSRLSNIGTRKVSVTTKYDSIKKRLEDRMKREIDDAKHNDKLNQQIRDDINDKYAQRNEALTVLMLRNLGGKTEDQQKAIRQRFAVKKNELESQKQYLLGQYKDRALSVQQKYNSLFSVVQQRESFELQPINQDLNRVKAQYAIEQNKIVQQKNKEIERLRIYQKKMDQVNQGLKKLDKVPEEIKQKTIEPLASGSVEFYDDFLDSAKKAIAQKMGLHGKHGGHMMDQITTFVTAGASTFFPSLTPMMAAAPLFMPLIPTMMATLGIGTLIAPIVGRIDQALRQQEPIKQRFTTLEGNPIAGDKKQQEIINIASKYSISVDAAKANFSQMAIAARDTNLTSKEMIGLFDGISASIKALGLNTQDANLIFMAYTQMLSKGKISMEELRQQLGERFPPAMSIFAKSLGVSTAALDEMVSRGAISTEQWVPKVTKVLKEDFGQAALSAGDNYASAITRIENVNFKLNKNFSDTYGGLFAGVQVGFANLLDTFNKNFKILNALAISGLIAVGASISIGLTYILRTPAINNFVVGGTSLLLSTFKFTLKALTPFLIGTLADVMDDVLGAKNNVFDNMSKGVGNFFTGIFTGIDQSTRNSSGMGLFDPFRKNDSNPFESIANGLQDLIKKIPSGVIEMTALVLMFEQVRVLGGMYIAPLFKDLTIGIANWGKAIKDVLANRDTLMRTMGDLFGGTLTSLTGVDKSFVLDKYKKDFKEIRELAQDNPLANFGRSREAVIRADMDKGLSRKDALSTRKQEFDILAKAYGLEVSETGKYLPNPANDPLVKYHERRDDLLKKNMRKEATSRALMFGAQIALEAGLALGIMSFAKGDFSNTIGTELNKTKTQMIASINSMNLALKELRGTANQTADSFSEIKLPSKGAQLDVRSIWDETKDFKWDDLIENINKGITSKNKAESLLNNLLFTPFDPDAIKKNKDRIAKAAELGLQDFYPKDYRLQPKMAEDQLLNNALDIRDQVEQFKKLINSSGAFDINNLSKPLDPKFKVLINEVNAIDSKLKGLGGKRVTLAEINTTQSRKEIGLLDIEINKLLKERKDKVRPFGEIEDAVTELSRYVEAQSKAIKDSNLPLSAKRALQRNLEPLKSLYSDMKVYFNSQGINQLTKPLEDVWDRVVNKLKDVESLLEKVTLKQKLAFNSVQANIYKTATNPTDLSIAIQRAGLDDLKNQKLNLEKALADNKKALKDVQAIANVGDTSEKKARIEELRKTINDQTQQVSDINLSIAKSTYEIKNNFQKEDLLRNTARAIYDFNQGVIDQQNQITSSYRSYARQIEDAQINSKLKARSMVEGYQDLLFTLSSNLDTAKNNLLTTQEQIQSEKLKQQNLSISPGVDSVAKQVNSIFNQLFDSLTNGEQEKRQANLDAAQIQRQYIETLRQIRGLEEEKVAAQREQKRSIEDLTDAFKGLIASTQKTARDMEIRRSDLVRDTKRQTGKDISGQLLPNPNYNYSQLVNNRVPFSVPMGQPTAIAQPKIVAPVEPIKVQAEIVKIKNPEVQVKINPSIVQSQPPKSEQTNWKKVIGDQLPTKPIYSQPVGPVYQAPKPQANNIIQQGINAIGNVLNAVNPFYAAPAQAATTQSMGWEKNLARLLNQYGSQMTVEDFKNAAAKSGVSIDALVTQAFIESHFGTKGRGKFTKNPLNYGNDDAGNNKYFKTYGQGLEYAAIKLKKDFFFSTPEDFINRDFKGRYGRYATDPAYRPKYQSKLNWVRNMLYGQMQSSVPKEWLVADASEGVSDMGSAIYQTNATAQARAKQIEANKKRQRELDSKKLGSLTQNWDTITQFWKQQYPESYSPEIMSKFQDKFIDTQSEQVKKERINAIQKWQANPKPLKIDASPAMLEKSGITKQIKENIKKATTEGITEAIQAPVSQTFKPYQSPAITDYGIPKPSGMVPVPDNLDYNALSQYNDKLKDTNTEQAKFKQILIATKQETAYLEAIDNLERLKNTLDDANIAKSRAVFDGEEELRQITRNAKGYQTAYEQNQKVGYDIWKSFEDKRRAIQDANREEDRKQQRWGDQKKILIAQINDNKELTDVKKAELMLEYNGLDVQMQQSKTLQEQLTIQNQQIDAVAAQTKQTAMLRDNEDRRYAAMKGYADLASNLASAQYNYGGQLINEAAIIKARADALQSIRDAKLYIQTSAMNPNEAKEYMAMTRELADINIKQSYVDAIPFLKEFSSDLKTAIFETNNFTEAISKLFKLAGSTVFDQFVLKPFQNTIAGWANELGIFERNNQKSNTSKVAADLIQNNIVPTNGFNIDTIAQTQFATDSLKSFADNLNSIPTATDSLIQSFANGSITQEIAIASFTQGLIQATLALQAFSLAAGGSSVASGLGGMFGSLFNSGNAAAGLASSSLSGAFGDFVQLPFFADGYNPIDAAFKKERAMSGNNPMLAVINDKEVVLSANNNDADLWRSLKANGEWDNLKATVPNYAQGTPAPSVQRSKSSSGGVTVNQYNTFVTPNVDSFRKSRSRLNNEMAADLRRTTQQ